MLRVTYDTNVLERKRERMRRSASGLDVELSATTVTLRERSRSAPPGERVIAETMVLNESPWNESVWGPHDPVVPETFTLGESLLGAGAFGGDDSPTRFEAILAIISNRSFPKPGRRDALTEGERRQLRDAMILEAHAREGRDVLVSDDVKAFGHAGDGRRTALERLGGTRIMTVDEFVAYAESLPREG